MKITLLSPAAGSVGGAETHTGHLCQVLQQLGHQVTLLGPAQCLPAGRIARLPRPAHAVGASLARRLPDWPHFSDAELVLSTDLMGAGITHPRHLHVLMGSYSGFRRDAVAPAKAPLRRLAQLLVTQHASWLERRAGSSLGALSPSLGLRQRLAPLGLSLRPEIIPPPVDMGAFQPCGQRAACAEMRVPAGKWLLFAGRWEYAKGADRALALAPLLPAGWGILVAGHGLAAGWHADRRIYSVGAVPASRMPLMFSAADLTFLPSRFEGSSLVVAESLASGTPVLTTLTGSGPDLRQNGGPLGAGVVSEPSPEAWLQALDAVLGYGDGLRDAARSYAERTYGIPAVTAQWGELISAISR